MAKPTRGFLGRGKAARDPRLPPGQYDAGDQWPVLNAEVTPHPDLASWSFSVEGLVAHPTTWTWDEIHALPGSAFSGDIHCVTTWSKLGVQFSGVSVDTLLGIAGLEPAATHVLAFSKYRVHDQPAAGRCHRWSSVGGLGLRGRTTARSNTADRRACWCRISIFGRVRNGWPDCGCSTTTNRDFGSATGTTIGEIRGSSSDTRAIRK